MVSWSLFYSFYSPCTVSNIWKINTKTVAVKGNEAIVRTFFFSMTSWKALKHPFDFFFPVFHFSYLRYEDRNGRLDLWVWSKLESHLESHQHYKIKLNNGVMLSMNLNTACTRFHSTHNHWQCFVSRTLNNVSGSAIV